MWRYAIQNAIHPPGPIAVSLLNRLYVLYCVLLACCRCVLYVLCVCVPHRFGIALIRNRIAEIYHAHTTYTKRPGAPLSIVLRANARENTLSMVSNV